MDHLCDLCLVFAMFSRLLIAPLWSPEGKRLTSWLLLVMLIVILSLSILVFWDICGTRLYRFLILAVFLTLIENGSTVAQWLDSRPRGRGFEPHRRYCAVVL